MMNKCVGNSSFKKGHFSGWSNESSFWSIRKVHPKWAQSINCIKNKSGISHLSIFSLAYILSPDTIVECFGENITTKNSV